MMTFDTQNIKETLEETLGQRLAEAAAIKEELKLIVKTGNNTRFKVISFSKQIAKSLNAYTPDVTGSVIHGVIYRWQKAYKYRDGQGKCCFRSYNDLGADLPFLSKTTIHSSIKRLMKAGLIVRGERKNGKSAFTIPADVCEEFYKSGKKQFLSFLSDDAVEYSVFDAILISNLRFAVQVEETGVDRRRFKEDSSGNRYYMMDPAILAKHLPYCRKRIADKLRGLVTRQVFFRYEKSDWFFHLVGGTKPNTSGTKANTRGDNCIHNSLIDSRLHKDRESVIIKEENDVLSLCNNEASQMPQAPLASLAVACGEINSLCNPLTSPCHESLASLAGSMLRENTPNSISLSQLDSIAESPDSLIDRSGYLTTAQKIQRLLPDEMSSLLEVLWKLTIPGFGVDENNEEALAMTGYQKFLKYSNYDIERLANIFMDTGFPLDAWEDLLGKNVQKSKMTTSIRYNSRRDRFYEMGGVSVIDEYVPVDWDRSYFWKRIQTPEQFWKYLPKLVREKFFKPVKKIAPDNTLGPIEWIDEGELDIWDGDLVQNFLRYLESDEYKSIRDTGVDVIALLQQHIDAEPNHLYCDVEFGEIVEGDPDYGFTDG